MQTYDQNSIDMASQFGPAHGDRSTAKNSSTWLVVKEQKLKSSNNMNGMYGEYFQIIIFSRFLDYMR